MNLSFSDEDLKFQSEVRSFIKDNYPADIKEKMDKVNDVELKSSLNNFLKAFHERSK